MKDSNKLKHVHLDVKTFVIQIFALNLNWVRFALREINYFGDHLNFIMSQLSSYMI